MADILLKAREITKNYSVGSTVLEVCRTADGNSDGSVTIDELVSAVNAALEGCQV